MSYSSLLKVRDEEVCGVTNWLWVAEDTGAWSGPRNDWIASHSDKYFKYLKGNEVVVTAGGNCGMYVRMYVDKFKTVYAFEPDPLNFHCMVNNNQFDNVVKMQCALGAECKPVMINRASMTNVGCHTVNDVAPMARLPMITIDSLNLPALDLLQLDIEGYEFNAIRGAINTIKNYRPVIVAERGNEPNIRELLVSINYEAKDQSVSDTIWVPES